MCPRLEMILDLPLLCEDRTKFNAGEQIIGVGVSICLADEFVERIEIQTQIQIVDKCFLETVVIQ